MQIILLDHLDKVGEKHDVVKVKDGYGRNYLLPKGLALVANKENLARLEGLKKQAAKKEGILIENFRAIADKLAGMTLSIPAKAGETGRLFGSVTAQTLSNALRTQGIDADRRIIEMPEEVKDLGTYTATIKFHPQVSADVKFDVVPEGAE
jgi:large subunit ribosomal protein L9